MSDNLAVYQAIQKGMKTKNKAVVATVVKVFGSSYRKEGAKMFIDETDFQIGLISGGCLESDVAEVAKVVMANGRPIMKFYDMSEDLVWGLGLGCPGKVQVYIEPINF